MAKRVRQPQGCTNGNPCPPTLYPRCAGPKSIWSVHLLYPGPYVCGSNAPKESLRVELMNRMATQMPNTLQAADGRSLLCHPPIQHAQFEPSPGFSVHRCVGG